MAELVLFDLDEVKDIKEAELKYAELMELQTQLTKRYEKMGQLQKKLESAYRQGKIDYVFYKEKQAEINHIYESILGTMTEATMLAKQLQTKFGL